MHTFSETGTGVPAFLAKLWRLVEDPETNQLIYWNRDGRSFIIQNQAQFARELLPMNYKHNNMASFIRQLNMYGFHKITSIENGGLKFDRDEMEFSHPCFKRGYPYLLEHIKRKIATAKTIDDKSSIKPEAVSKVLNEVKAMRGRQDSLDSRFSAMKQENEALWREIAVLRQKHMKQQQIVNKLIQFLVTIVQPSRNMSGVKRNFQLMINDVPQSSKLRKRYDINSGPIIHELTEELLDEVAEDDEDLLSGSPHVMSPGGNSSNRVDVHDVSDEISRPRSTASMGSLQESIPGDEYLASPSNIGHTSSTPDPDSESIVYQITELPDNNEFIDEYILQQPTLTTETPQKVVNAAQRQSIRRGRKRKHIETETGDEQDDAGKSSKLMQGNRNGATTDTNAINIKKEKDIDPLSFLDNTDQVIVDAEFMKALDPCNQSRTNQTNDATSNVGQTDADNEQQQQQQQQMYITQDDFISNEMPADLFEVSQDSPMVSDINLASGVFNPNMILTTKGRSNDENSMTTTGSVLAATAAASSSSTTSTNTVAQPQRSLSVTKYNNDEIMRLSSPHEITTHLDTVQGDLDSLRDLLRSEGYSFDANTLLNNGATGDRIVLHPAYDSDTFSKLFSDSDILGPYGLQVGNDSTCVDNKKGNELMTYQPNYYSGDLSDMLNLEVNSLSKDSDFDEKPNGHNSVLNTPLPERD